MRVGKRFSIALLAVFFVLFWAFAFSFAVVEINHECSDINCRICEEIQLCENFLRGLSALTFAAFFAVLLCKIVKSRFVSNLVEHISTLITLKVKLSD